MCVWKTKAHHGSMRWERDLPQLYLPTRVTLTFGTFLMPFSWELCKDRVYQKGLYWEMKKLARQMKVMQTTHRKHCWGGMCVYLHCRLGGFLSMHLIKNFPNLKYPHYFCSLNRDISAKHVHAHSQWVKLKKVWVLLKYKSPWFLLLRRSFHISRSLCFR